jgi:hypothetical protein
MNLTILSTGESIYWPSDKINVSEYAWTSASSRAFLKISAAPISCLEFFSDHSLTIFIAE